MADRSPHTIVNHRNAHTHIIAQTWSHQTSLGEICEQFPHWQSRFLFHPSWSVAYAILRTDQKPMDSNISLHHSQHNIGDDINGVDI